MSFKLGVMGDEDDSPQQEAVDQVTKQRMQGDEDHRDTVKRKKAEMSPRQAHAQK